MSVHSWLQSLRSALAPSRLQRKQGALASLRAATNRLNVEALEDRLTPSFTWAGTTPVGEGLTPFAQGSATADFNGDGWWDTATLNGTHSVSLRMSNGDGTYSDAGTVGTGVYSVAAGDFTSDGVPDLLVGRYDTLSVLPGHGDGTFAALINSGVYPTGDVLQLAVADFNGDSQLDVITVGYNGSVNLGRGDGSFAGQYKFFDIDGYGPVIDFATGDFNGDACPDLAAGFVDEVSGEYVVNTALNNGDWGVSGPYLSLSNPTVAEGNTGTVNANFTLTLAHASNVDLTFNYNTSDGSATAGSDYQASSGTLTIPAGQTTGTISVLVNGDSLPEPNESFFVNLSSPTNANVTIGHGTGTIVDGEVRISIADAPAVTEGNASTRAANFTVSLSAASSQTITVAYATANDTATVGIDFTSTSGILTFAPGETSKAITVPVIGDRLAESNETFVVNLNSPTNATIADGQGVGTILDDEPRVSISDLSKKEGNSGLTTFAFTIDLSVPYDVPVTIGYSTANGTATAGGDYQAASGTLTIPVGQTSGRITVQAIGDRLPEPNETLFVNLSNSNYGVVVDGQGVGTILDDEPRISIGDVTKQEGKKGQTTLFTFTVTLSAAYDQAVTMSFQTANGTAKTSDDDYVARGGTLTFAPGETTKTITIEVKGDSKKESDETFYLDLFGNSTNSLFTRNRGVGTILNDD